MNWVTERYKTYIFIHIQERNRSGIFNSFQSFHTFSREFPTSPTRAIFSTTNKIRRTGHGIYEMRGLVSSGHRDGEEVRESIKINIAQFQSDRERWVKGGVQH